MKACKTPSAKRIKAVQALTTGDIQLTNDRLANLVKRNG
jgi:hypothetical protein